MSTKTSRETAKLEFNSFSSLKHFGTADRYADWSAVVDIWYMLDQIDLRRYPNNPALKLTVRTARAAVRKLLKIMRREYWSE